MFPSNLNDFIFYKTLNIWFFQQLNFRKNFKREEDSNPGCSDLYESALTTTPHGTLYKWYNTNLRTVTSMIQMHIKLKI